MGMFYLRLDLSYFTFIDNLDKAKPPMGFENMNSLSEACHLWFSS